MQVALLLILISQFFYFSVAESVSFKNSETRLLIPSLGLNVVWRPHSLWQCFIQRSSDHLGQIGWDESSINMFRSSSIISGRRYHKRTLCCSSTAGHIQVKAKASQLHATVILTLWVYQPQLCWTAVTHKSLSLRSRNNVTHQEGTFPAHAESWMCSVSLMFSWLCPVNTRPFSQIWFIDI